MFELHHVDIWINKVEESIFFYNKLGFEKVNDICNKKDNKRIIILEMGQVLLEMKSHFNGTCFHNKPSCCDNKILGFAVDNIDKAKKYIIENNLYDKEILIKEGVLNKKYFIINDPNGNNIEFIQK